MLKEAMDAARKANRHGTPEQKERALDGLIKAVVQHKPKPRTPGAQARHLARVAAEIVDQPWSDKLFELADIFDKTDRKPIRN